MLKNNRWLALSLLLIASSSWGTDSFYLGVGLGAETATFKQYSTIARSGDFAVSNTTNLGGRAFTGSIYGGYDFDLCCINPNLANLALAFEIDGNFSTLRHKTTNSELLHSNYSVASYKLGHSLWFNLLPGYYLSDCTQLYVPLGFGIRSFRIATSEVTIPNVDKVIPGFRYGLGIKQYLNDCLSMRFEYSFASYRKTTLIGVDVGGSTSKITTFAPFTSVFLVGLTYHF